MDIDPAGATGPLGSAPKDLTTSFVIPEDQEAEATQSPVATGAIFDESKRELLQKSSKGSAARSSQQSVPQFEEDLAG